jgi:hypothetical protein
MNKLKRMGWTEYVEMIHAYRFFVENLRGNRPFKGLAGRSEHNTEVDLKEIKYEILDWILLSHDSGQWRAFVNIATNIRVP